MLENNKREIKLRSSFSGSSKAWARGRRLAWAHFYCTFYQCHIANEGLSGPLIC